MVDKIEIKGQVKCLDDNTERLPGIEELCEVADYKYENYENKRGVFLAQRNKVRLYAVKKSIRLVTPLGLVIVSLGNYKNAFGYKTISETQKQTMRELVKESVPELYDKLDNFLKELDEKQKAKQEKKGSTGKVKVKKRPLIYDYVVPELRDRFDR